LSDFIGTFIIGENKIVCRQYDKELRGIPPGRWDVLEATPYVWKLVAPGYGAGENRGGGPVYLSKERYGRSLPREFVPEPRASVDLVRQVLSLGGDGQERLDDALRVYLNRQRVIAEWAQAVHLDGHDSPGVIMEHD